LIDSIYKQVTKIILVSNENVNIHYKVDNCNHINLKKNYGIAYAQNVGIKMALEEEADFILTSDQDTMYPEHYVENMLNFYNEYKDKYKIAAVAPCFKDLNSNRYIEPIQIIKGDKINKYFINKNEKEKYFIVSHVISSGMLIEKNALKEIGLMKEEYFIDWVDTEWCWRAYSQKYCILQNPNVIIQHVLGDNAKIILNYSITEHNSIRRYYRVRNAVYLLLNEDMIDNKMRGYLIVSLLKMFVTHFYFSNNILKESINKYFAVKDAVLKSLGQNKHKIIEKL
jgi:rhamnosyltransferase